MKTLFYDTETTGLPNWSAPSEDPSQPRVMQLAAELFDVEAGKTLAVLTTLISPDGWTIPDEITALTGITTAHCEQAGVPMTFVLPTFISMWRRADLRVAHNESFDMRMIRIELMRHDMFSGKLDGADGMAYADYWKAGKAFCTQAQSVQRCKLPPTPKMLKAGRTHFKSPNLGEAYRHFTGKELDGAHDAEVDVAACKAVYLALRALDAAKEPA